MRLPPILQYSDECEQAGRVDGNESRSTGLCGAITADCVPRSSDLRRTKRLLVPNRATLMFIWRHRRSTRMEKELNCTVVLSKNPQVLWKCSKSASAGSSRPVWNSFVTVGARDFSENGCILADFLNRCVGTTVATATAADYRGLPPSLPPFVVWRATTYLPFPRDMSTGRGYDDDDVVCVDDDPCEVVEEPDAVDLAALAALDRKSVV